MSIDQSFASLKTALTAHGQGHVLAFWNTLTPSQRADLGRQVAGLDLDRIDDWVRKHVRSDAAPPLPAVFEPAPAYPHSPPADLEARYTEARALGHEWIAAGRVGAFVVAGGQGTRLGYEGPKGCFPASPIEEKPLFQLFAESILAVNRRYQVRCPWYVMTSPLNHEQTRDAFAAAGYFGLEPEDVFIFEQGTLPNFGCDGRMLMADRHRIARSPDGHGGSLKALHDRGALTHMAERGVDLISYWQVDNPLVTVFDPLFIGLHVQDRSQMSSKALKKTEPLEKVGNFCLVDGRVTVVEYSDLPESEVRRTDPEGRLIFEMGSIGIHLINRDFVEQLNRGGFSLPLHRAVKRIPHLDEDGRPVAPGEPNGVKLETFVFDALPVAERSIILETVRSEEFAPIKNATGVDSAESSRRMMVERAAIWLEAAGVAVPRAADGRVACTLEIAPSFAVWPEDVTGKTSQVPPLEPGGSYYLV